MFGIKRVAIAAVVGLAVAGGFAVSSAYASKAKEVHELTAALDAKAVQVERLVLQLEEQEAVVDGLLANARATERITAVHFEDVKRELVGVAKVETELIEVMANDDAIKDWAAVLLPGDVKRVFDDSTRAANCDGDEGGEGVAAQSFAESMRTASDGCGNER
ncbi:hypothetical protein [Pseudoalteromonas ulvae]|uniref:Chemotaxis protein n=1 Tax=Pseudoalteromonas ulvae TaxID=107327 RepID=A0A244CUE7_PSEDV|nr:hypothetical protein [Pseudoalteromonas ulvae]OUL59250.1 hypothetical protein B1199_02995 [Pseudoalteromonas ulvae]